MAEEETNDSAPETAPQAPEAATSPAAAAPAPPRAAPAEPAEILAPKERRRRARSAKAAKVPTRGPTTPEDRQAERSRERQRKAGLRRVERERSRTKAKENGSTVGVSATPPREHVPGVQKTRQGVVVSNRADKTIVVRIDTARRHRRYEKIVRTSRTLHAHDETNDANIGDTVVVRESRPLSRTKRWRLIQVVQRAQ
jgi:small subunit ribosomal protein S17